VSRWENEDVARNEQRPARKYYKLTAAGRQSLDAAVVRYRRLEGSLTKKRKASKA
jgi:hypothetical protein